MDLDLQTRSKATRQKRKPVESIKKTSSTAIMKVEEGRSGSRSSLLLKFFLVGVRVFWERKGLWVSDIFKDFFFCFCLCVTL